MHPKASAAKFSETFSRQGAFNVYGSTSYWKCVLTIAFIFEATVHAGDLKPETLRAWDEYVHGVQSHTIERACAKKPFLWLDENADRRNKVRSGKIVAESAAENGQPVIVDGEVHDWIGAVFVPTATVADVLAVVRDYDRYKQFYRPIVADARVLERTPDEGRFEMIWVKKVLLVTAAIESEYSATYTRIDDKRWYGASTTTRVQEIEQYGKPGQHKLAPGEGRGYLWRLYTVARYQECDGGVFVEIESAGLSRPVPAYLRWIAERLSRDGLVTSLEQTRDAVRSIEGRAARLPDVRPAMASSLAGNKPGQ